jgi:F-type H+-transporting ATPase subunit b
VRSAFDLPANQRAAIQNAINETFSADIHLRFETAPDLISGIELTANGQKVAWTIADYLGSLEKGVGELLQQQDKPEPKAVPKPEVPATPEVKTAPKPAVATVPQKEPPEEIEAVPKPVVKMETKVPPNAEPESEPKKALEAQAKLKPEIPAASPPNIAPKAEEAEAVSVGS